MMCTLQRGRQVWLKYKIPDILEMLTEKKKQLYCKFFFVIFKPAFRTSLYLYTESKELY